VKANGSVLDSYTYSYDQLGNITAINRNGTRSGYAYDVQNQLTASSEGYINYEYTYDTYGNILSVKKYDNEDEPILLSTDTYTYGNAQWLDRLTAFNGQTITYDGIGNPLSYYNGSSYTFTWNGRELATAVKGSTSVSYKYGADGLRTQKTVGSTVYNYYYADGRLVRQTWGSNYIDFLYDESGSAYSFIYNGTQYYYVRNLQGDVVKILNTSGGVVASYTYDAWGKVSNSGNIVGLYNPIRYRGYYYDTDTGFYYLQSRYYDPTIKRFINADGYISTGQGFLGFNMYAYCGNNPVMGYDPYGTFDWESFGKGTAWLSVGVTAICVGVSVLTCGVATPAMMAVAAVTVAAGTLTTINGASEIGEAATGHNFVQDDIFQGNKQAYDIYSNTTAAVAEIGTIICGKWRKSTKVPSNCGRPFETGQCVGYEQIGVDPNSLKLNTSIHPGKYQSALEKINKEGMYGVIEVFSDGTVYNGNHRVYIARKLGIAVDTIVVFLR
jgi:RHS repeat-associated protein